MSARLYHEAVIHRRGRLPAGGLDWANQPSTFKNYPGRPHIPLPRDADLPGLTLWEAFHGAPGKAPATMEALSAALFHGAGLTGATLHGGREVFHRACPSAGALYPCEVYLSWPGGTELAPGLYHYDVSRHGLTALAAGRPEPASLGLPGRSAREGEALLFVTAIFYRSSWKYRARSYRYLNLDAGHVAEGLALGLAALGLYPAVETDFDDQAVAGCLGLDPSREGCLAVVRFASGHAAKPSPPGPLAPDAPSHSRTAASDQPALEAMAVHAACSLPPGREGAAPLPADCRLGKGLEWKRLPEASFTREPKGLFEAMALRASRRDFAPAQHGKGMFARVLAALSAPLYPAGHPGEEACLTGALTGADSFAGAAFSLLDRRAGRFAVSRRGDMRRAMAGVCLDQRWMGEAALHALFLVDFTELEPCLGARGYRAALIGAGRLGHRAYLAAGSLGLGACGVGAFHDEEASELLGLPPGAWLAYVVAVGPVKGTADAGGRGLSGSAP